MNRYLEAGLIALVGLSTWFLETAGNVGPEDKTGLRYVGTISHLESESEI